MGARWKIKCSSIGIILVLVGCGTTLGFDYGQSSSFKTKPRGLMDFFGNVYQQSSQEHLRSWSQVMRSADQNLDCNHWGLYQKPVQQADYERHFYNFGEQGSDMCSDEGMDYGSLDFSCQEASAPDNNPCGGLDSDYSDQAVNCNDDEYGIRWKGSPLGDANFEIEEVISKGGQWSTGGGEPYEDEVTPHKTPNFNGLTNVDVHKCVPQNSQGGNGDENGLQSRSSGDEYFLLVIKKDHLLGDAVKLNKSTISIDAIIGASLQPAGGTSEDSSVNEVTPSTLTSASAVTPKPGISPTKAPPSSTRIPITTPNRMPDQAVLKSVDDPPKISFPENSIISSSTPSSGHQQSYPEFPASSARPATPTDEVASLSTDGPTKISSNPTYQVSNVTVSEKWIPSVTSKKSPTSTAVPSQDVAPDSQSTVPASPGNKRPIDTVDSQSEGSVDSNSTAIKAPENIPQPPGLVDSKPQVIVNTTTPTEAPITTTDPAESNKQLTEMSQSSDSSYGGVTPSNNSREETPTIVNESTPLGRSQTPTPVPAVYKTKSTEEETPPGLTKTDPQPKPAVIVNDVPTYAAAPQSTHFGSVRPSDEAMTVGKPEAIDGNSSAEGALQSETTIVNDVSPQPTKFGSSGLGESTLVAAKIKPGDNSADGDLQPTTGTIVNDMQDPAVEEPKISADSSSVPKNYSQSAVMGSKSLHDQVAMDSTEISQSSLPSTVTTPAFPEENKSPTTSSNSSPTVIGNNRRANANVDAVDAVSASQSETPRSSPNFRPIDVPTTVIPTNPPSVTASIPQSKLSGTTSLDAVPDPKKISNMDTLSSHNTSSNAALSPSDKQKPDKNSADTGTRPYSTGNHPESERRAIVNESTEADRITIPKGDGIASEFQGVLESTSIASAYDPGVKAAVPSIGTPTSSTEPASRSQSTKWNSDLDSKEDNAVPSTTAPVATDVNTTPIVLSSQSPMSTIEPVMGLTMDHPTDKNDPTSIEGVMSSETTESPRKPDSTVNETTLSNGDPSTTNEMNTVPSVTKTEKPGLDPESIIKLPIVNDSKSSDHEGTASQNSPAKDLSHNRSTSANEMPTTTLAYSSQLPDATVNHINSIDPPANDLSDSVPPSSSGITEEPPTTTEGHSSPSPDLMTPSLHSAPPTTDLNDTPTPVNTSNASNSPDFATSSESPEVIPVSVVYSTNTLSSSPPDPVTDEEPLETSTPVTFTETSYDASSFTSTKEPVPTEEPTKSSSRPKGIHKFLSFMSWMRGKKSADNATTPLIESAFDPIEEIIEPSGNDLAVIDKDILPENLANWFLGFHSAEDDDTSLISDVTEVQSSEVPDASVEFKDLYHSFIEAAIHNINNSSSIVNGSEPIGTPSSWWSSFREVDDAHNNTLATSSAADADQTGSQSTASIDRGFLEGAIHRVNDDSTIVNGSASTWRRWMSKLRGYKNMLKGSHTLNGASGEANQSSTVEGVHNSADGYEVTESTEQAKGESSWFSRFWTSKSGGGNVSSTETPGVMEGSKDNRSETSAVSTNATSIRNEAISQSVELHQNSTAKANNTQEADDDSSTVKIIITKPKAEWMSLLADIQAAQGGSISGVNGTVKQPDAMANDTSARARTYSHFHGSDFEVWSGENM